MGQTPELALPLGIRAKPDRSRGQGWSPLSAWPPAEGTWASGEGVGPLRAVSRDLAGPGDLLFPASGLHTFTGNPAGTLARPADLMFLSPDTSPCLSVLGSLGTRRSSGHKGSSIPQCPSCSPTSCRHPGPWPRCGLEGSGRRTQPLRRRGSSAGLPSLPPVDGSLQGP